MPKRQRSPTASDEDEPNKRAANTTGAADTQVEEDEPSANVAQEDDELQVDEAQPVDLLPEAELCALEPYSVNAWLAWLKATDREALPVSAQLGIYERAVAALPGSYKLWRAYALSARAASGRYTPGHAARKHALQVSLRAACALRRAPRLWEDVIEHCVAEGAIVSARRALDDAVRALPVTQHDRIWAVARAELAPVLPVAARAALLERYSTLRPELGAVDLFDARCAAKKWDAAVSGLLRTLKNADWDPPGERSRDELWVAAVTAAVTNPDAVRSVNVPDILRKALSGDKRLAHGLESAALHKLLARHHIRSGDFDGARRVYEDAVTTTASVRDFALLFDAWTKLEEGLANAAMRRLEVVRTEEDGDTKPLEETVEEQVNRLDALADRRPLLLSDTRLRANPHNVHEWHKRARLHKRAGALDQAVLTYKRAQNTVDATQATAGRPHTLWLAHAAHLETNGDVPGARVVLEEALNDCTRFAQPHDVAVVWCEYAEMELRLGRPRAALAITHRATKQPDEDKRLSALKGAVEGNTSRMEKVSNGIFVPAAVDKTRAWSYWRSGRVWALHLDLVAALEPPDAIVDAHHSGLDGGALDEQVVANGAALLAQRAMFEQAFRLLDRATQRAPWPECVSVWACYVAAYTRRYGVRPRRRERARALWDSAVEAFTNRLTSAQARDRPERARQLIIVHAAYARWEPVAAARRRIWTAAARTARTAGAWRLAIARIGSLFGAAAARPVYMEALSALISPNDAVATATRFARLEAALGEIDRARALYKHAATVKEAANLPNLWKAWSDFELAHGDEDNFRDMLREKRNAALRADNAHVPLQVAADAHNTQEVDEENQS